MPAPNPTAAREFAIEVVRKLRDAGHHAEAEAEFLRALTTYAEVQSVVPNEEISVARSLNGIGNGFKFSGRMP